jgi:N-acetylmuramoyl-L-alanine amidase
MVAAAGPTSIEAIFKTRAAIAPQRWQAIVIHHSGSAFGSPSTIEAQHKAMNLDGLGYHFLVGNGSGLEDGEVHVGYRWLDQVSGAHVAGKNGDWYNRNSIGICLIGDFSRQPPTERQMWRLSQLVSALADELKIPSDHIYLHSDVAAANDPGAFFPEAAFRAQLARAR